MHLFVIFYLVRGLGMAHALSVGKRERSRDSQQPIEKPMTLEKKISQLLNEANHDTNARFDVVAFELWGNSREGFDTNTAWYLSKDADADQVLQDSRGRWEAFKVNYLPKARVADIQDTGYDSTISLEVDCVPFLEIRLAK